MRPPAHAQSKSSKASQEFQWLDPNYDNLALPSIVNIQSDDPPDDVLQGYDFPATPDDARQYAAHKMLAALEFVRMTFADMEASKRKGYYTECRKIVAEALPKRPHHSVAESCGTAMTPLKKAVRRRTGI